MTTLKKWILFTAVMGTLFILFQFSNNFFEKPKLVTKTNYSEFIQELNNNKIISVTIADYFVGSRELLVTTKEGESYKIVGPKDSILFPTLVDNHIQFFTKSEPPKSMFGELAFALIPTFLIILVMVYFMKKAQGGKGGLFKFGQNKAQLLDPSSIKETFDDVIGCDEAKLEVKEFEEFLKQPEKFSKLGGTIPRGVLFSGPSGTGKTLLAKALAKSAGVPFYFISGSDFVEMFVGVGAARVRDMFEIAKKNSPCILFIDEIDAIGSKRGNGFGGGNEEREQTLNQILVELDGMKGNQGVILVGATNRPEVLDPALLRPGRFDRQVTVGLPDVNGRDKILKLHGKATPMSANVDLFRIARGTPGFSGAELKNLINEAAIFAARRNKKFVEQSDLEEAKDKILLGLEKPNLAMSEQDKLETAYHESGHAIIAKLLKDSDPIYKVTIIPRGQALGLTVQLPEKDRFSYKQEWLRNRIAITMGGRAAEEIFCNTFTSGASNDIQVATSTARSMIMKLGMSDLGPIAFGDSQSNHLGNTNTNTSYLSQKTLETVDNKVSELINQQYKLAYDLLNANKEKVEAMTAALMEVETIEDWQVENIMKGLHFNDSDGEKTFKLEQDAKQQSFIQASNDKKLKNDKKEQNKNFNDNSSGLSIHV